MEIYKDFRFEAAHLLPRAPDGHKCKRLHGHSFKVRIWISGAVDPNRGWIMDLGEIKNKSEPIIDELDHQFLNELPGLENPTSENIAKWLWVRIKALISELSCVEVQETCSVGVRYYGRDCASGIGSVLHEGRINE